MRLFSDAAFLYNTEEENVYEAIQINEPARYNSFTSLLLEVYVWLNMFRALPRPSSGVYN